MNKKIKLISCASATTGIGRYVRELHACYLAKHIHSELISRDYCQLPQSRMFFFPAPKSFRNSLGPFFLKRAIRNIKTDIIHADYVDAGSILDSNQIRAQTCITTVHDGIPFRFPKSASALKRYQNQLKISATYSSALIVVSETSKQDLLLYSDIPSDKIFAIYNGINHKLFYPSQDRKRNSLFTIRYHGGLSTGHKNTQALLEVCKILEAKKIDFVMELAGANPNSTGLPSLAKSMKLKNIKFVGFIPDSKIQSYLSNADAYIYPSKYEGFGFPPLEAMACGTPVVSSNGGSLGEILDGAALLSEPNPEALVENLLTIYHQSEKAEELRNKGLLKVKSFTWENCASQTLQLYEMYS